MRGLLQKLLAKLDPGCASVSRTVSDSLDRPLSLKERWDVAMHMVICGFCRRYGDQLQAMRKLFSDLDRQEESPAATGPSLSEHARERIRKALEASDKQQN